MASVSAPLRDEPRRERRGWRKVAEQIVQSGFRIARHTDAASEGWPMMWLCFVKPYLPRCGAWLHRDPSAPFRFFALLAPSSRALIRGTLNQLLAEQGEAGNKYAYTCRRDRERAAPLVPWR